MNKKRVVNNTSMVKIHLREIYYTTIQLTFIRRLARRLSDISHTWHQGMAVEQEHMCHDSTTAQSDMNSINRKSTNWCKRNLFPERRVRHNNHSSTVNQWATHASETTFCLKIVFIKTQLETKYWMNAITYSTEH